MAVPKRVRYTIHCRPSMSATRDAEADHVVARERDPGHVHCVFGTISGKKRGGAGRELERRAEPGLELEPVLEQERHADGGDERGEARARRRGR